MVQGSRGLTLCHSKGGLLWQQAGIGQDGCGGAQEAE